MWKTVLVWFGTAIVTFLLLVAVIVWVYFYLPHGVLPSRRGETVMRQTRLPRSSEMIARITKTTNSTHAILVAAPAMPLKPSTAAMSAMTKKMTA